MQMNAQRTLETDQLLLMLSFRLFTVKLGELLFRLRADGSCLRGLRCIATAHLPLHQLRESTIWVGAKLLVAALFGHSSVRAKDDNCIRALDGGESVGDTDCCVVATEKGCERAVYKGL